MSFDHKQKAKKKSSHYKRRHKAVFMERKLPYSAKNHIPFEDVRKRIVSGDSIEEACRHYGFGPKMVAFLEESREMNPELYQN